MDFSSILPFLNLFSQNFNNNQTPIDNNQIKNDAQLIKTMNCYPTTYIDGNKINNNSNNTAQNPQTIQNDTSNGFYNQDMLIKLLTSLAPNLQQNNANPLINAMQTFLNNNKKEKPKKEEKETENNQTQIENFKNVDDVDLDK